MKKRFYLSLAASLLLGLGLTLLPALSTQAQNLNGKTVEKIDPKVPILKPGPGKTVLKCEPASSDVSALVRVTNNTSQTITKGTKIFAKNQKGLSGNVTITNNNGLKPNEWLQFTLGGHWTDSSPCSAYYSK